MMFEAARLVTKVERLSYQTRTDITDEFLDGLPKDSNLYQVYFMNKQAGTTKETATVDALEIFRRFTDIERTALMNIAKQLVGDKDA